MRLEKLFGEMGNIHSTHIDREPSFLAFFCAQLFPYYVSEVQELSPGAFLEGVSQIFKEDSKVRQEVPFLGNIETDQNRAKGWRRASWKEAMWGSGQSSFSGVSPEFKSHLWCFITRGFLAG